MCSFYIKDYNGIQAVMTSNAKKLTKQDENAVRTSGVPYNIIRTGILENTPGGKKGFSFKEARQALSTLKALVRLQAIVREWLASKQAVI